MAAVERAIQGPLQPVAPLGTTAGAMGLDKIVRRNAQKMELTHCGGVQFKPVSALLERMYLEPFTTRKAQGEIARPASLENEGTER
ncbi:hypothetical protein H4I96_02631 [Botrytis cinerea]